MIESMMYFGIGFLFAALSVLVVVPLVHGRAVRLTTRRLEAAIPSSMAEILARKDLLRAEFAVSTRRLEMNVEQLKTKNASQLAELGKKGDASHTIEMAFKVPSDFPFGGVSNVLGILMKEAEETRGAPLAVASVKITSGIVLIGLSASESDMQRNRELLNDRSWFDIAIVYDNGRRAILAIEKGAPGERAFKTAFAAWK